MPRFARRFGLTAAAFALGLALAAGLTATPVFAQPAPFSSAELSLRVEIEDRYDVLLLRSAVALRPHDDLDGVSTIEVAAGGVAIDGEIVDEATLRGRIGAEADLVLELARLGDERGRALFSRGSSTTARLPAEAPVEDVDAGAATDGNDSTDFAAPAPPREPREPGPPEPPDWEDRETRRNRGRGTSSDARVAVGSRVVVDHGEVSDEVVAFGGGVTVDGTVHGPAVAIGGTVVVNGKVTEDVVAVGGRVELGPESEVLGDVTSVGGRVLRAPGAKVYGQVSEVAIGSGWVAGLPAILSGVDFEEHRRSAFDEFFEELVEVVSFLICLAFIALICAVARIFGGGAVGRLKQRLATSFVHNVVVGLVFLILLGPLTFIVAVILLVSILGIPLLALLPFAYLAVVLGWLLGYVAVAELIGEAIRDRFGWHSRMAQPLAALAVGLVALHGLHTVGDILDLPNWGLFDVFSMFLWITWLMLNLIAAFAGMGAAFLEFMEWRRAGRAAKRQAAAWVPPPPSAPAPSVSSADIDLVRRYDANEPSWERSGVSPGATDETAAADMATDTEPLATRTAANDAVGDGENLDEQAERKSDQEPNTTR